MKYKDVMFGWTPTRIAEPPNGAVQTAPWSSTIGTIKVGPHPDPEGWSRSYFLTDGSCNYGQKKWPVERQLQRLLKVFHQMVVQDGIDPMAAHREFMKIDEYREILCREFLSSVME